MVPGMGHCIGGEGPDTFDKISLIERWVEKGEAPARVIAAHSIETKSIAPVHSAPTRKSLATTAQAVSMKRRISSADCPHDTDVGADEVIILLRS